MRGEELGVFAHGSVEVLEAGELGYFKEFYGEDAFDWDEGVVYYRLHPHWMTVYAA
jgi:hypothetical protein